MSNPPPHSLPLKAYNKFGNPGRRVRSTLPAHICGEIYYLGFSFNEAVNRGETVATGG